MQLVDAGGESIVLSDCHILVLSAKEPRLASGLFLLMSIISIRNISGPKAYPLRTLDNTCTQSDK